MTGAKAKTAKKAAAQSTPKVNGNGINTDGMSKADISTLRAWEMIYEKRDKFIK